MAKRIISQSAIDALSAFLAKRFSGSESYQSQNVLHIEASADAMMGYIEVAKDETLIPLDYNILIEYQTCYGGMKFVMHCNSFICEKLVEKYGGRVSNSRYWIIYNEPQTNLNWGYREILPTAQEIIEFMEKLVGRN